MPKLTSVACEGLDPQYSLENQKGAFGILISITSDKNTLNINKNVEIKANKDIDICTTSNIETEPFMSLGKGQERLYKQDGNIDISQEDIHDNDGGNDGDNDGDDDGDDDEKVIDTSINNYTMYHSIYIRNGFMSDQRKEISSSYWKIWIVIANYRS